MLSAINNAMRSGGILDGCYKCISGVELLEKRGRDVELEGPCIGVCAGQVKDPRLG